MKAEKAGRHPKAYEFEKKRQLTYAGAEHSPFKKDMVWADLSKHHITVLLFYVYGSPYFQINCSHYYPLIINATRYTFGCLFHYLVGKIDNISPSLINERGYPTDYPRIMLELFRFNMAKDYIHFIEVEKGTAFYRDLNDEYSSPIKGTLCFGKYPRGIIDYGVFTCSKELMEKVLIEPLMYNPPTPHFDENKLKLEIP